ncbi:MAG: lipopolysaccharide biosynthesis regulator YciM [Pseudohongiellaceae bacterium]|jgi:lipopolysaccharide biosynthesis regulator YciM
MRFISKLTLGFLIGLLSIPMLPATILAGEEQRAPPEARSAGTLSDQVMRAISSIQELMSPEDPDEPPNMEGAKRELDELYERRYDRMNDFEKSTILNFYTNYYLTIEDYPGALRIFEQILTIETLREDIRLRTLRSLGQIYAAEENWQGSIDNYVTWRALSFDEDQIVFRGLSYAHYQLEQYLEAEPYWLQYMEMALAADEQLGRDDYAYLNGIYFTVEDYAKALNVTKTMIMLFDDARDWLNLSAVYASVDDEERRVRSLNLAYLKGVVEDENRYLNLGQSMAGIEIAHSGSKIIEKGLESDIIEGNKDNIATITQMLMISSEFKKALPYAERLAELDETGDGFDTLGYIQYVLTDYEAAAEAFKAAVDKGNLTDKPAALLFLARALLELDEFDAAEQAAKDSAEAGDRRAQESASNYINFITATRSRTNLIATRKAEAIDFYESYPPIQ